MEDLMQSSSNNMTDAQAAEWHYEHQGELDANSDEDEEITVEYDEKISVTMSFRLPAEEAQAIRRAASKVGMSQSEWIRNACATAAGHRSVNAALRDAIRSLERDVDRIRQAAA